MRVVVYFECATPRQAVAIHAWDNAGYVDDSSVTLPAGQSETRFRFELNVTAKDCRSVRFKFRFPGGEQQATTWESDDTVRRLPADAATVWCYEFSARCLTKDPAGKLPAQLTVHLLSHKFANGSLYAWRPNTNLNQTFPSNGVDGEGNTLFRIAVPDWMRQGFHFKFVSAQQQFESDWLIRIWRACDAAEVWIKAGQLELHPTRLAPRIVTVGFVYPRSLPAAPKLVVDDVNDDYSAEAQLLSEEADAADGVVTARKYTTSVFPDSLYQVHVLIDGNLRQELPLQITQDGDQGDQQWLLLGYDAWQAQRPRRTAHSTLTILKNDATAFQGPIIAEWGVGRHDGASYGLLTAQVGDGWSAELLVFPGVPHWMGMLRSQDGTITEGRGDGPITSQRTFIGTDGAALFTRDGVTGMASAPALTGLKDVPLSTRRQLMKAAFDGRIVDADVFGSHEMPHGATVAGDHVWFVLYAPHAVKAQVLLLTPGSKPRNVKTKPMSLTTDLRYWWCAIAKAECPVGQRYRFLLNDDQEVVDPAAQLFTGTEQRLWALPNEDENGPWSVVVDRAGLLNQFAGSPWRTPPWDHLVIYEMHCLRLTRDHRDAANQPLAAFDQVIQELAPGGYLHDLRVTALEFLPVFEFSPVFGWGYSANAIRAIESSYGGPLGLARCVRAAHDAGKAILLDVVDNHLAESGEQAVADDVYCDGQTQWGSMVNYDHPVAKELYRQVLVYLWDSFQLDGFRFDATRAIVDGDKQDSTIIANGQTGSGGGWFFLKDLRSALQRAASACGRPWPYLVAENDPNQWNMNGPDGVLEGQWNFQLAYPMGEAAINDQDKSQYLSEVLSARRAVHEMVNYACSHDSVSLQEPWKKRMVVREKWGNGMRMAKAVGSMVVLGKGLPMIFAGQCAGENEPFFFGMDSIDLDDRFARLQLYRTPGAQQHQVYKWFRDLLGLRLDGTAALHANDDQWVGWGRKTLACHRLGGQYVVIGTFGTPDTRQALSWLKLSGYGRYKEIFNSTWDEYKVDNEPLMSNGGYDANLGSTDLITVPPVGAIVLERR